MQRGLAAILGGVWAMRMEGFEAISHALTVNLPRSEDPERGALYAMGGRKPARGAAVAVMGLYGVIMQRSSVMMEWIGGTSTEGFGAVFDSLVADPGIKGIVIDAATPGGTVPGVQELSDKIYAARSVKPIVAVSNSMMASAGFWVGSAASKVFVAPGSDTGSIGVFSAYSDYSEYEKQKGINTTIFRVPQFKAEFSGIEPLSDESKAHEMAEINAVYGDFVGTVSRNRGVSESVVRKTYGEGRCLSAKAAVECGMADRVATLSEVVRRMDAGKLTLGAVNAADVSLLEMAFADELPDESWRERNETARRRSELHRKGVLS